jgi:hypothetical protein
LGARDGDNRAALFESIISRSAMGEAARGHRRGG